MSPKPCPRCGKPMVSEIVGCVTCGPPGLLPGPGTGPGPGGPGRAAGPGVNPGPGLGQPGAAWGSGAPSGPPRSGRSAAGPAGQNPPVLTLILVLVVAFAVGKFGTDTLIRDGTASDRGPEASEPVEEAPTTTVPSGRDAIGVCDGTETSIPDATAWKAGEPGIVANFTFDHFDSPGVWSTEDHFLATAPLRTGVSPDADLADVSLVLCRGRGALQTTTTCNYVISNVPTPVEVRFWKRNLRLLEARTGRVIGNAELSHDSTQCSNLIMYEAGDETTGLDEYPDADERPFLEQWTAP